MLLLYLMISHQQRVHTIALDFISYSEGHKKKIKKKQAPHPVNDSTAMRLWQSKFEIISISDFCLHLGCSVFRYLRIRRINLGFAILL